MQGVAKKYKIVYNSHVMIWEYVPEVNIFKQIAADQWNGFKVLCPGCDAPYYDEIAQKNVKIIGRRRR